MGSAIFITLFLLAGALLLYSMNKQLQRVQRNGDPAQPYGCGVGDVGRGPDESEPDSTSDAGTATPG